MGQRAAESAGRAALEESRKRSLGRVFHGRTGAAAPILWARVCPLAPFSLVPLNTPGLPEQGICIV